MADDAWTDIDYENERIHKQLDARKAGSSTNRDAAYQEWASYLGSLGGGNAETDRDFENAWRQSAEASEFGGAGLDRANTWASNFASFKPRLEQRWLGEAGQDATDDSGRSYRPMDQWTSGSSGGSSGGNGGGSSGGGGDTSGVPTYQPPVQSVVQTQQEDPNAARIRILLEEGQARDKARADELWGRLSTRASQGLAIDRNDPVIRAQADAYRANEDRATTEALKNLAEQAGPLANLQGEQRLAAERIGQRTGAFESELMGRELTARRDEIAQALAGMGGMLTADQQRSLTQQLSLLDNAIKEKQLALTQQGQQYDKDLGWGRLGLDTELGRGQLGLGRDRLTQDWQQALMQNEQFLRRLGLDASQFASDDDYRRSYIR